MRSFLLVFVLGLAAVVVSVRAEERTEPGWSADLLHKILQTESPRRPTAPPASGEMVLRSYHLAHLQVGEAGKARNVLAILGKLLPSGSSVNTDVPANTLHVLTTLVAHQAAWEYLSAVDVAEPAAAPAATAVPDDVRAALKKLAGTGNESAKLLAAIDTLKADVSQEIAAIDARQRQQTLKLLIGGAVFALVLAITVGWMLRRRAHAAGAADKHAGAALVLAPEQLTTALTPVHDKLRGDMLGLLNEVAIKLQAQHNEQQKLVREQQQQLEDARHALAEERRQFISETGTMVVQAVERVDATTAKLAKQQDKVAELVQELQNTVRELDETKDNLRTKQVELEQERSKIAALSILLEEGGLAPNGRETDSATPEGPDRANGSTPALSTPCMHPVQTPAATAPSRPTVPPPADSTPRFQFLPPDHPET